MSAARRPASLSVDLDDRWTYLQARGTEINAAVDPSDPGFLPLAVERALGLLAALGVRATFFVAGRDAARAELAPSLRAVVAAGHELGNHSFDHLPWLAELDEERQGDQIERAEETIASVCGVRPCGFRGPGHARSSRLLGLLAERGYLYDASALPTFLAPLARWAYLRPLPLDAEARFVRRRLGGRFAAGFGSNRATLHTIGGATLVEIPVTTLPLLRLPIHFTYLQLLAARSRAAASLYASFARFALRLGASEPSLLLHATDFLGREDGVCLDFFPGMRSPLAAKLALVESVLRPIAARYELGTLEQHARIVAGRGSATRSARWAA